MYATYRESVEELVVKLYAPPKRSKKNERYHTNEMKISHAKQTTAASDVTCAVRVTFCVSGAQRSYQGQVLPITLRLNMAGNSTRGTPALTDKYDRADELRIRVSEVGRHCTFTGILTTNVITSLLTPTRDMRCQPMS